MATTMHSAMPVVLCGLPDGSSVRLPLLPATLQFDDSNHALCFTLDGDHHSAPPPVLHVPCCSLVFHAVLPRGDHPPLSLANSAVILEIDREKEGEQCGLLNLRPLTPFVGVEDVVLLAPQNAKVSLEDFASELYALIDKFLTTSEEEEGEQNADSGEGIGANEDMSDDDDDERPHRRPRWE